jgi:hypothetical protein
VSDWELVGDQMRCNRHPDAGLFPKLDVCPGCIQDPEAGGPIETAAPQTLDPAALGDEQWCREQRDALIALAEDLTKVRDDKGAKDRVGYSTVAKLYDTALKFHRAAADERRRRGEHDHERWLVKQCRELAGGRVSN